MAGVKMKAGARIEASSLVEVLVSMIIIVTVFSIAMGIYSNVLRLSLTVKKYQARAILQQESGRPEMIGEDGTQSFTRGNFRIDRQVTIYHDHPGLKQVQLSIFDENNIELATTHKVIYVPQKN